MAGKMVGKMVVKMVGNGETAKWPTKILSKWSAKLLVKWSAKMSAKMVGDILGKSVCPKKSRGPGKLETSIFNIFYMFSIVNI